MKTLKISSVFRKLRHRRTTTKPKIILSGNYLQENGFFIGSEINVIMEPGMIIIKAIN